jgi:predicted alpha/beta-fold hydrolase
VFLHFGYVFLIRQFGNLTIRQFDNAVVTAFTPFSCCTVQSYYAGASGWAEITDINVFVKSGWWCEGKGLLRG